MTGSARPPRRRFRISLTLELMSVMSAALIVGLVLVIGASERFLRSTGAELIADQDRIASGILVQSAIALKEQAERTLAQVVRDKARQLDASFRGVERIVNLEVATSERLLASPEAAPDVTLVETTVFNDPRRRPGDFRPEPGKDRKVSLGTVLWHRAPGADPDATERVLRRLRGSGFLLRTLYRENPLSAWIYLGTEEGLYLGYPADDSIDPGYDPRARDWYREAKRRRALTWSLPYVDTSGTLLITCSRPFFRVSPETGGREVAGVAAADVTIEQLNGMIGELEAGFQGYAFLLDDSGRVITSPDIRAGKTRWDQVFRTENLLEDEHPDLAAAARRMVGGESGVVELDRGEGPQVLAFAHVEATDWSLGVLLPQEALVGPAKRHEEALEERFRAGTERIGERVDAARTRFGAWGIFGVFLLVTTIIGFVYLRLTRPIRGFIKDIRVIGRGNLDHKVTSATENELGDLAAAFNDLTAEVKRSRDQIEEYSRTLERRVEERTAALEASNVELEDALKRLKEAQGRMVHSEKMASLGQLVAGIAHEINNPVNFIANSVAPLQGALDDFARLAALHEKGAGADEIAAAKEEVGFDEAVSTMRRALELVRTGAGRTKEIVLQLRNFSRLDEAEMKEADLHEGLDGSLALLNYRLKDRIEVVRDYGEIGRIHCNPGQLNQVFMNLLSNAVQAIQETGESPGGARTGGGTKGTITVITRRAGDEVTVRIRDTGAGIDPAHLPRIFEPFFTTKAKDLGTGLGLAISQEIVTKHGGRIDVTSESGQGTEFVITLPAGVRLPS